MKLGTYLAQQAHVMGTLSGSKAGAVSQADLVQHANSMLQRAALSERPILTPAENGRGATFAPDVFAKIGDAQTVCGVRRAILEIRGALAKGSNGAELDATMQSLWKKLAERLNQVAVTETCHGQGVRCLGVLAAARHRGQPLFGHEALARVVSGVATGAIQQGWQGSREELWDAVLRSSGRKSDEPAENQVGPRETLGNKVTTAIYRIPIVGGLLAGIPLESEPEPHAARYAEKLIRNTVRKKLFWSSPFADPPDIFDRLEPSELSRLEFHFSHTYPHFSYGSPYSITRWLEGTGQKRLAEHLSANRRDIMW